MTLLKKSSYVGNHIFGRRCTPSWSHSTGLGESIFTEADDMAELHTKVRDAVKCHFDEGKAPKLIRLHHVREEVIAV